jgi:SAM-dependent methyltransferase
MLTRYQKPSYGGRSLEHHRLAQRQPELCAGEDDGLLAVLDKVFAERAQHLPMLFDPQAPGVALKPSAAAIKRCMALLSDTQKIGDQVVGTSEVFRAPDAFGWAYQYWNTEEKDRVFEKVRTQKGAKIEGADIIPATQLYTEPYMVKFLVQNSLGATWMGMHPDSQLPSPTARGAGSEGRQGWEYYVHHADRAPVEKKAVAEITFLDPACGSGHFLLEAFDLFYDMYVEEGQTTEPEAICRSILEKNLYGIDIDPRAVQIAEVALWMKAADRAFGFEGKRTNLVAAVASHLKGPLWEDFLASFEREPSVARVLRKFGQAMEHIDQLGSLARPDEQLRAIVQEEHAIWERQVRERREANFLFPEMIEDKVSRQLPFHEVSDEDFGERMLYRARAAIHAFSERARHAGAFQDQFLGYEASAGFKLLDVLSRRYDVVAANPPYMGSKNMGPVLKGFLERYFPLGKRDVYAAFMLRCRELLGRSGHAGMVTLHTWMFTPSYRSFRLELLDSTELCFLGQLGRHAFDEADPPGLPVLSCWRNRRPTDASQLVAFRLSQPRSAEEQADLLRRGALQREATFRFARPQKIFRSLPDAPLCFWLGESVLRAYLQAEKIEDLAAPRQGLARISHQGERTKVPPAT